MATCLYSRQPEMLIVPMYSSPRKFQHKYGWMLFARRKTCSVWCNFDVTLKTRMSKSFIFCDTWQYKVHIAKPFSNKSLWGWAGTARYPLAGPQSSSNLSVATESLRIVAIFLCRSWCQMCKIFECRIISVVLIYTKEWHFQLVQLCENLCGAGQKVQSEPLLSVLYGVARGPTWPGQGLWDLPRAPAVSDNLFSEQISRASSMQIGRFFASKSFSATQKIWRKLPFIALQTHFFPCTKYMPSRF